MKLICWSRFVKNPLPCFLLLTLLLCLNNAALSSPAVKDLPSWREGHARQSIIDFVKAVTSAGPDFVKPEDRIAVFDNDGTLWCEAPIYPQLQFAIDRAKQLVVDKPSLAELPPVAAAVKGDLAAITALGPKGTLELLAVTHSGMTTEQFSQIADDWIRKAQHPRFKRPYTDCVYQPMLELLSYLRQHGFKTYIVSGGGVELMRSFSQRTYGIAPEQVIGSSCKLRFEMVDGKPQILRLPEVQFVDDKEGKPVGIQEFIGRRPIAAFGNSDGDLAMLQYTCCNDRSRGRSLGLIVHHTDAEREYAYDRVSMVGRLDKALDEAKKFGWTVVDMKGDWNRVFAFDHDQ